jgi:hypothetical protein
MVGDKNSTAHSSFHRQALLSCGTYRAGRLSGLYAGVESIGIGYSFGRTPGCGNLLVESLQGLLRGFVKLGQSRYGIDCSGRRSKD